MMRSEETLRRRRALVSGSKARALTTSRVGSCCAASRVPVAASWNWIVPLGWPVTMQASSGEIAREAIQASPVGITAMHSPLAASQVRKVAVPGAGDDPAAVGGEGDGVDVAAVAAKDGRAVVGLARPEAECAVEGGGENAVAVGVEIDGHDRAVGEGCNEGLGGSGPDAQGAVVGGRRGRRAPVALLGRAYATHVRLLWALHICVLRGPGGAPPGLRGTPRWAARRSRASGCGASRCRGARRPMAPGPCARFGTPRGDAGRPPGHVPLP